MMASLANKNLLIVDDEQDIAEILRWELASLGANCTVANGPAAAIQIFNQQPIDGIISDIRMPQQSGIDLLKNIRGRTSQLPFLLMTGFADVSLPRAHDMGAEALVGKPFELDDLCRTIEYYLRPLSLRWPTEALVPQAELEREQVEFGRGGFLVHTNIGLKLRPKVGETVIVRLKLTDQVFRVICRWYYGESWGAEIVAWDNATQERGWPHTEDVSFIPLQQLK